jgi:4-amino-4-deoxy-L-arabinose transferase-like glycosyltransferase
MDFLAKKETATKFLWLSLILLLVIRFFSMGWYPLMDSTEARYADVARRMVEKSDWITLWFTNTDPFWGKPPFSFWLSALSFKIFGQTEFAARLPHFLTSLGVVALALYTVRERGRRWILHVSVLLFSALLFMVSSAAVITDMSLTLGTTLVMVSVWQILQAQENSPTIPMWHVWMGLGWVIGFLAKGPLMLVVCGAPIFLWAIYQKRLLEVWSKIAWLKGFLGVMLLTLPWYILAEIKTPGFLNYFIVGEHFQRFVDTAWAGDKYGVAHAETRGEIWFDALIATLPWPVLLPILALMGQFKASHLDPAQTPAAKGEYSYWLFWGLWPCVFFTFSGNILWTYVLPGLPALAILLAFWTTRFKSSAMEWVLSLGVLATLAGLLIYVDQCQDSDYAYRKVAISVVNEYQKRAQHAEPLYFYGDVPFSASYYTQGQAKAFHDWAELPDVAYVVFDQPNPQAWSADIREQLIYQSSHGERQLFLWRKNKPQ